MNYNFENIAGYEVEKEELKRLCEIFNNREKHLKKGAKLPKGIIFYGEAGTGKTLFSKVMASVCGLEVFKIDLGDVEDESAICAYIKKTFVKASKRNEPTMIFFDEMDKVLPNDDEEYYTDRSKTILTQLLTLIDGMDSAGNIVFVATCNNYNALPETLTRPGRLDKKIGIGVPNYSSRVEILKMYIQKSSCKFETPIEDMAKLCSGFSCAGIETLINECILQSSEDGLVSGELFQSKLYEIKNEDIPRGRYSADDTIHACRNVGSFIVAKTYNNGNYILSIDGDTVCSEHFNSVISDYDDDYGCDYDDDDEDYDDYDVDEDDSEDYEDDCDEEADDDTGSRFFAKDDLINTITVLLGGYVAEELFLNKIYDNISDRLSIANQILCSMFENGMFGLSLHYSDDRNDDIPYMSDHVAKINDVMEEIIQGCYEKAKSILINNETIVMKLIPILTKKQVMQMDECEKLLTQWGGIKC